MQLKRFDPTKITVYPDHSTLCASFKAHRAQADAADYAAYLPLRDWFERVAREANLCLSNAHIVELFRWQDLATADEMARWYDMLPIVWVQSMHDDVHRFESERWTRIAAGVGAVEGSPPFATSLLKTFHSPNLDALAPLQAEREPSLAMVRAMRRSQVWYDRFEAYRNGFVSGLVEIVQRNQLAESGGWTEERKCREHECSVRVALVARAKDADACLTSRSDASYARKHCDGSRVPGMLVECYEREPKAMPLFRLTNRFNEGAVFHVKGAQIVNGQPSRSLRGALQSSFGDYMHLVGGAYCDVFTCDGTVSKWLGDLRTTLGLRPQLAVRGYPGGAQAFVSDLMATWP